MIELRNKQYARVFQGVAGEALEVGQVVTAITDGASGLKFVKISASAGADVWGTMVAHWINPRSTSVHFSGGEDGLSFPLAASTDLDAIHYIPSGARMVAIGGKDTEIRFYKESLNDDFATTLPSPAQVLGVSSADAKLCLTGAGDVISGLTKVARVTEVDEVSVTVCLA